MRFLLIAMALASSLLVEQCDLSLGDLDQFVINYKIMVTNAAREPAAVNVSLADKQRRVTLQPGASVEVISFNPGVWRVAVEGTTGRLAILRQRRNEMIATLDAMKNQNSSAYEDLDDDVDDIEDALEKPVPDDAIDPGSCAGSMSDRAGEELTLTVSFDQQSRADAVSWHC